MRQLKVSRRSFIRDLTRTRHMTAVSVVILGTTFMPLLGAPDIYELRAFQSAIEGFSDARAAGLAPRRDDEAARERSAESVIPVERDAGGPWQETSAGTQPSTIVRPSRVAAPDEAALIEMIAPDAEPEPLPVVAGTDRIEVLEAPAPDAPDELAAEQAADEQAANEQAAEELQTLPEVEEPVEEPVLDQDEVEPDEEAALEEEL